MFDVCVVGSANLDLVATVQRLALPGETVAGDTYAEYPGGKGLNQAVAAARAGANVAFVGAIGGDTAGVVMSEVLRADGIDATFVHTVSEPTGRALIGVSASGENSIIVVPGANATVTADEVPACKVLLVQFEVPLQAVRRALVAARAQGSITVLNPAPAIAVEADILQLCDVVVPNEHEVELLGGVAHLLELGVPTVVVTLGSRGAAVHTTEGVQLVPAFKVDPVDTTGAGDTFCGSLCARLAADDDLSAALDFASAAAALSTTKAGAIPSIPSRQETVALQAAG